jgi:hypothetical protein
MSQLISKSHMLERLNQFALATETELRSLLNDTFFDDSVQIIDYTTVNEPLLMHYDDADTFADVIGDVYQDVVARLQENSEADANSEAYWDLAAKHILKHVHDAILSEQDIMRHD